MVPVGGIHVVPAGLTYSTFLPLQARPVQLTIPAVSVIHKSVGTPWETIPEVSGTTHPDGVAGLGSVVPCIPIGQIRVPGLKHLSAPGSQPLPSLSVETVNLVGLAGPHLASQAHPPGLALNAVGLQLLTAKPPCQRSPTPQAHVPSLQIFNIALPALIPSVSQVPVDTQGAPDTPAPQGRAREARPKPAPAASASPGSRTASPQGSPRVQRASANHVLDPPAPAGDPARPEGSSAVDAGLAASVSHGRPKHELPAAQGPPDRPAPRPAAPPRRPPTVPFSDASSDEDEDRLVIAT